MAYAQQTCNAINAVGGGDFPPHPPYADLMAGEPAHFTLKIDTESPIEIGDFVGTFVGVASQYEKYIKSERPDFGGEVRMFVREVRAGCIEADIVPLARDVAAIALSTIEQIVLIDKFVEVIKKRLGPFLTKGAKPPEDITLSDAQDFNKTVRAVAHDSNGSLSLSSAHFVDAEKKQAIRFDFTTKQAQTALEQLDALEVRLTREDSFNRQRVMMTFSQLNTKDTPIGKKTNERAKIEELHSKDLPIFYASEMARSKIKQLVRESDENIFRKGFVVDANVVLHNEKPAAYRITDVHDVIDLD